MPTTQINRINRCSWLISVLLLIRSILPVHSVPLASGKIAISSYSNTATGANTPPTIAGCTVFPADNIWNTPIDWLPVHPNSDAYVATIGANTVLHPDFGSGLWNGGPIGIPFVDISGTQPGIAVSFTYADESDPGPYPIPTDAPIEGGSSSDGDRHVLVLDRDNCLLYEIFNAQPQSKGSWRGDSGAIFDLSSHALRPETWTSADAAGLPILPGLVRYDEVASGEIHHALRFTAPQTRRDYVWPARHFASSLTGEQYPPMGQRFRLRHSFDISGFSPEVQVILQALKTYGMTLADNGSPWFISGAPDERWNNNVLRELRQLTGADFEAVDISSLIIEVDSGQARGPVSETPTTIPSTSTSSPTETPTPSITPQPTNTPVPVLSPTASPTEAFREKSLFLPMVSQ